MQEPIEFTIAVKDFVPYLLPGEASKVGTDEFKNAVVSFYAKQFADVGGSVIVGVDDENIHVQWIPDDVSKDPFGYVLRLLQHGELEKAIPMLETFLAADPDDVNTLYNLGMALSDLGRLDEAKSYLKSARNWSGSRNRVISAIIGSDEQPTISSPRPPLDLNRTGHGTLHRT